MLATGGNASAHALDVSEQDWDEMMDVNAKGLFFTAQAAGRVMVAQCSGRIVAI